MIQKFFYHGNVTPHFSLFPLMKSLVIFSMDWLCLLFKHSKWHFLLISASVEVLDEVEVEYITLPGWMTSIENCRTFSELPVNAQSYVRKIEEITQIPGQFIIKSMHTSSCFLVTKPTTLLNILKITLPCQRRGRSMLEPLRNGHLLQMPTKCSYFG